MDAGSAAVIELNNPGKACFLCGNLFSHGCVLCFRWKVRAVEGEDDWRREMIRESWISG